MPKSDNQERDIIAAAERLMRIAEAAEGPAGYGTTPNFLGELGKIVADVRQQTRTALVEEVLREGPEDMHQPSWSEHGNPERAFNAGSASGHNRCSMAWRSILLKAKGDKP